MTKLEELRAKLRAQDTRNSNAGADKSLYPFWDIATGENATIRFLPDLDEDNTFFWVEKQMINLTFPGIAGHDEGKEVTIKVPCVEMFGDTCPVHNEIRPWFNEPSLEETARKYWKKRQYIFSGFVVDSPLKEKEEPENPIRRFSISAGLFKIIKSALLDPDMESLPTDYEQGTNFTINKGQNGKWADYGTSKYARRETALSQEQLDAIEEHGLVDLKSALPKKPTDEGLAAIYEMWEASVNGELYDPTRWAKFYRPYGFEYKEDATSATSKPAKAQVKAAPKTKPAAESHSDVPFDVDENVGDAAPEAKTESKTADDIINMIRNRKA